MNSVEVEERESVMDLLRQVMESFLYASVLEFLALGDVLCMRTTAVKWIIAVFLCGPFAELLIFS